jgi:hypothetical protein
MPILAVDTSHGADPTPTVKLLLDGIQEMLARNDSVLRHLVSALTRVLIEIHLLTGNNFGIGTRLLQVLGILEDGCEKSSLLLSLLLLLLCRESFLFSLGSATLLLTELDLILHLLDVAVIRKNEAS